MAGDVKIKIVVDTTSLDSGLKRAEKELGTLQKTATKSVSGVESALNKLGKGFKLPKFDGFAENLNKAKDRVKGIGDTGEAQASRLGTAFAKVGTIIAGALAGAKILEVGKECMEAGAFAQEMQNKFDVVWANTGDAVDGWSRKFGIAIGRSNTEIKDNVTNLGDLLEGYGMTEEQAGELSEQVVELSYDLA